MQRLKALLDELPEDLRQQVFTHASWTDNRADSYSRLAFLGDSVLGLAVTTSLFPRLEAERYGAGRLTKIRAQAVSGPSCKAVAVRIGVPERLARRGQTVTYEVTAELGPPHDRTFEVVALVEDEPVGRGSGRSKKHAEQDAAQTALDGVALEDEDVDEEEDD